MDRLIYRRKGERNRTKNRPSSSFFNNYVSRITLLIVSVFLLYNVGHSISITIQKLDVLQMARLEVDDLRLRNLELALLIENIQGVEYLEVQARDRLKFAGEGEYVFVIPEDILESAQGDLERILMEEKEIEEKKVYEVWGSFLLKGV